MTPAPSPAIDPDAALGALANPARRRILRLVWREERASSDIAERVGLSRPATSQHLKVLREADLVTVRPDANRRLYRVRPETLAELRGFLDSFWGARLDRLKTAAEQRADAPDAADRPVRHER